MSDLGMSLNLTESNNLSARLIPNQTSQTTISSSTFLSPIPLSTSTFEESSSSSPTSSSLPSTSSQPLSEIPSSSDSTMWNAARAGPTIPSSLSAPALDKLDKEPATSSSQGGSFRGTSTTSTSTAPLQSLAAQLGASNQLSGRKERKLRVSYSFRPVDGLNRHCFGVNSLAIVSSPLEGDSTDSDVYLFSAGRDSAIRCWNVGPRVGRNTKEDSTSSIHVRAYEHHTDWVNDIIVSQDARTLVSCSSDSTIKVWDVTKGNCVNTFCQHIDYVKALAYAPHQEFFASGGLDCNIYIWDLETCRLKSYSMTPSTSSSFLSSLADGPPSEATNPNSSRFVPANNAGGCLLGKGVGHKESIYSLAANRMGTVLVSGSTEKVLRVWDPRTGIKQFKLRGHKSNIKAVVVNTEGTLCLSGSSDSTVKLWDLGQQRCIRTFNVHQDSVWSIVANESFTKFYTGGRDGKVFCTDISSCESQLVCSENSPVLKVLLEPKESALWVTTTTPVIKKWDLSGLEKKWSSFKPRMGGIGGERVVGATSPSSFTSSTSASPSRLRLPETIQASNLDYAPLNIDSSFVIPGRPGIVKYHILNNRRHILTKDDSGHVQLWDVTTASLLKDYGTVSFEDKVTELFEMVSIPTWFSLDTKTGSITVHLVAGQGFNTEMFAADAGLPNSQGREQKINIGERILNGLFLYWLQGYHKRRKLEEEQQRSEGIENGESSGTMEQQPKSELPLIMFPKDLPIIISEEGTGAVLHRFLVGELEGSESIGSVIPRWVAECLLEDNFAPREPAKIHVKLISAEPDLLQLKMKNQNGSGAVTRVTAPRFFPIRKLATFILGQLLLKKSKDLQLVGLDYVFDTGSSSSSSSSPTNMGSAMGGLMGNIVGGGSNGTWMKAEQLPEDFLEYLCNHKVMSPEITLGSIRTFHWKASDDVVLYYRINPKYLPPTPNLHGGSGSGSGRGSGHGSFSSSSSPSPPSLPSSASSHNNT